MVITNCFHPEEYDVVSAQAEIKRLRAGLIAAAEKLEDAAARFELVYKGLCRDNLPELWNGASVRYGRQEAARAANRARAASG